MNRSDALPDAMLRCLLPLAAVAALALGAGCGGKVFIDVGTGDGNGNGNGGAGGGSSGSISGGNAGGGSADCALKSKNIAGGLKQVPECSPTPADGCPDKYDALMLVGPSDPCTYVVSVDCGPVEQSGKCCYLMTEQPSTCH